MSAVPHSTSALARPLRVALTLGALGVAHHRALGWWVEDLRAGEGVVAAGVAAGVTVLALGRSGPASPASRAWDVLALAPIGALFLAPRLGAHGSVAALAAILSTTGAVAPLVGPPIRRHLWGLAALWVAALPVGDLAAAILGYPLRVALAQAAASVLGATGAVVSTATVLSIEGGAAHVDTACAGLGGLWTLGATLVTAHVVFDLPPTPRAFVAAGLATTTWLLGNLARIVIVVGLHHALGAVLLADILHVPLGLCAFAAALGAAWTLLPAPSPPVDLPPVALPSRARATPAWLVLGGFVPASAPTAPAAPPAIHIPGEAVAPSAGELAFAAREGASVRAFQRSRASVTLVAAVSPWAHHSPERCLTGAGWTLTGDGPRSVGGVEVRAATATRDGHVATAVWWFESADTTTDDLAVRIRDGLLHPRPWVLVSALVPDDDDVAAEVLDLHTRVHDALESR